MADEPHRTDGGQADRVTEQVQNDEQPQTFTEAVTEAADKDPSISMDWEKKIKDKVTGNGS